MAPNWSAGGRTASTGTQCKNRGGTHPPRRSSTRASHLNGYELEYAAVTIKALQPLTETPDLERYCGAIVSRLQTEDVSQLATLARAFDQTMAVRLPGKIDSAAAALLQRLRAAAAKPGTTFDSSGAHQVANALLALPHLSDPSASEVVGLLVHWCPEAGEQPAELLTPLFTFARPGDVRLKSIAAAYYEAAVKRGTVWVGVGLGRAAQFLDADSKRQLMPRVAAFLKDLPVPDCSALAPLASDDKDLPTLFDVLKWPTCRDIGSAGGARSKLQARIAELLKLPPSKRDASLPLSAATPDPRPELPFFRAAAHWAKQNHYDLAVPAKPPMAAR